jgi:D-alanyl-D-alanine carboxypeptidase/D-alanyl-D-alanine-endopeptidase (penicillin-binding protein 4)
MNTPTNEVPKSQRSLWSLPGGFARLKFLSRVFFQQSAVPKDKPVFTASRLKKTPGILSRWPAALLPRVSWIHRRIHHLITKVGEKHRLTGLTTTMLLLLIQQAALADHKQFSPCIEHLGASDAMLVADPKGRILSQKNAGIRSVPASTLKLLTALTAIEHLGLTYRFKTEFYVDAQNNLKIKGYGDPLLISEVLREIAGLLAQSYSTFKDLILDASYYEDNITIPGNSNSTNPYDAPLSALSANFNTIFFEHDKQGQIISAEPQTPLIPFARAKIRSLKADQGRYTFTSQSNEAALYAGRLFLYFLKEQGVGLSGKIFPGKIKPSDKLIYTYRSRFTLEVVIKKMLEFSNNFIANQIFITLGVKECGPPGRLSKGAAAVKRHAVESLGLKNVQIVEGSGISRKNQLSAREMLVILKHFAPYRRLLAKRANVLYKSGTLSDINTRAGYVETPGGPYPFVIFLNRSSADIHALVDCVRTAIGTD